ncbi:spore germination protein [Clostridium aestuarii]|uniref:Spore germination protein n=1 Tax=Clostridium aestuarii TaxID=338193 RepID=A0ABT4CYN4_9CLOT|nr:spore germination protein [Clostridium aestuarii]MCY6484083.1 spore germination protein [Clostridium aestuarii]
MRYKSNLIYKINEIKKINSGISIRKILSMNTEVYIIYISQLTDKERLSNDIIKPILQYNKSIDDIDLIANSIIYIDDISIDNDENKVIDYILKGKSIIVTSNAEEYIIANTLKIAKRSIESPQIQNALKSPRDSFTENFETNLSLIRYRIKDSSLAIDNFTIGKRTKTNVAVVYLTDVTNPKYVNEVKKKLNNISIDGIIESGYIQKFIKNNTFDIFPQVGIVERSDAACACILKGKVCIIVEGSNLALILPQTFFEFLDSGDDHYDNIFLAILSKSLRIFTFMTSLTLSALYVTIVGFHPDILPEQYILILATSRAPVPVNALLEITLMEIVSEILREASIRLPKQIGAAIGIVGTIVIGQAAVTAGLVSPLTVIIISLSTMTSFVTPDYTIMHPVRILKFMLIFISGTLGLFGFTIGMTFIAINLVSTTSMGVPYASPIAPLSIKDLKDYILSDITLSKKRPRFLSPRDKKRQ